jgi:ABC-2 type transport system permease protein
VLIAAPGTADPRRGGGMMGMMQPPQEKGDIQQLWDLLGIDVPADPGGMMGLTPKLAWQDFNPYSDLESRGVPDEWIFASVNSDGGADSINPKHDATAGIKEILFPVPGMIQEKPSNELEFTKLVTTGTSAGRIAYNTFRDAYRDYGDRPMKLRVMLSILQGEPAGSQTLAAQIKGELPESKRLFQDDANAEDADDNAESGSAKKNEINVIYVTDIDLMMRAFLQIRARPGDDPEDIQWKFENVTFILNILDVLAGERETIAIRRHKPVYYTLKRVNEEADFARNEETKQQRQFNEDFEKELNKAEKQTEEAYQTLEDRYNDLVKRQEAGEDVDPNELRVALQRLQSQQELARRRFDQRKKELERQRDKSIEDIRRKTDRRVADIQFKYKLGAILFPPIPPLLVGIIVFTRRRLREREGVSRNRLVL